MKNLDIWREILEKHRFISESRSWEVDKKTRGRDSSKDWIDLHVPTPLHLYIEYVVTNNRGYRGSAFYWNPTPGDLENLKLGYRLEIEEREWGLPLEDRRTI